MSKENTPQKAENKPKKNDASKAEVVKTEKANSENKTADNSVSKKETAPKSASQSSISHFSSVSTPEYRSGWDNIFGENSNAKEINSKQITKSDLPKRFNLFDYDVDFELRAALDKTLTDVAEKRGFDLKRNKETTIYEYSITCEIKKT
jgi:hypothetical protein